MQHVDVLSRQRLVVIASVVLLHGLALWALQTGLLQRMVVTVQEVVVPVSVLSEPVKPRVPEVAKAVLPDKTTPPPKVLAPAPAPAQPALAAPVAQPLPLGIADSTPAPQAPTGAVAAQAPAPPTAAVAAIATPAPPKVELPSSVADYLHNPKPKYPRLSQSRNEQGTVILSVLVGVDGRVRDVVVKSSSGFELLDRTAREAVLGWTFVSGKRNGAAVEMSVDVPIPFRLTD